MTPGERLTLLEAAAEGFTCGVRTDLSCPAAWNGYIELGIHRMEDGFWYHRDIGVTGGGRKISRERALEYIAGTVSDPLAD